MDNFRNSRHMCHLKCIKYCKILSIKNVLSVFFIKNMMWEAYFIEIYLQNNMPPVQSYLLYDSNFSLLSRVLYHRISIKCQVWIYNIYVIFNQYNSIKFNGMSCYLFEKLKSTLKSKFFFIFESQASTSKWVRIPTVCSMFILHRKLKYKPETHSSTFES